jgi:hypothetical protein
MSTNEQETAVLHHNAPEQPFILRDHVIAQLDHVTPAERAGVLATATAFARGEIEGTRLSGAEPYFRLQAAPDLLIFVEQRSDAPVKVFDITRPATLRMFANAAHTK